MGVRHELMGCVSVYTCVHHTQRVHTCHTLLELLKLEDALKKVIFAFCSAAGMISGDPEQAVAGGV